MPSTGALDPFAVEILLLKGFIVRWFDSIKDKLSLPRTETLAPESSSP